MAKLSERVEPKCNNVRTDTSVFESYLESEHGILRCSVGHTDELISINNEGETNMSTTLRTINLTLVDNNSNLKGEDKIVFQKLNYVTEYNDEKSIQQILMSGAVAKSLGQHNLSRTKVVDKEIRRNTGRDVTLEEVEIFDLDWMVVRVA